MIKVSFRTATALLLLTATTCLAQAPSNTADFKQVYDVVSQHVTGLSNAELNRIAVESFVKALHPKVALVSTEAVSGKDTAVLSKAMLLEGPVAYLRVAKVDDELAKGVREACRLMSATNKLVGLVLDLRYVDSDDYAAAASTADLFLKQERKLFDWGKGMSSSKTKSDALTLPVATLVNHETGGAPEALAAALRETGAGLIVGSETAGHAMVAEEFALNNGQQLRIATGPLRLGNGSELTTAGLKPDISVQISPRDEKAYYEDGFREIASASVAGSRVSPNTQAVSTNRVRRTRYNEADLVRERKEGFTGDLEASAAPPDDKPVVHDPALARALDVLKGLAVVRGSKGT